MKKLFYFLAAASMVAVACAKEETVKENVVEGKASGNVTLTASMPEFTNADTKAAVSDAGVFSWTAGDIIDVVYEKSGSADKIYQFECTNASTGEFTNVDAIDDGYTLKTDGSIAFYPHEYNGTPSSQTFDSPALAAKGFQMHATYSAGNLAFVHDNAMMKVTIKNVPSFAEQIVIGGTNINVSYTSDQASVTCYVPMAPSASAKLSIAVKDDSANDIVAKASKNAVAIVAANYYPLNDLEINKFVVINNSVNSTHRLGLGIRDLAGNWVGSWATFDFNSTSTGIKYYVLPDTYAAAEAIQVELRQNDGSDEYAKSTAEFMIPVRNLIFDASDSSLKTAYRCYASFDDSQWGYWIAKGTDKVMFRRAYGAQPDPSGSDTECTEVAVSSGKLFYYEFLESEYGYNNVYWGFYNDQDTDWKGEWDNATINRDFIKIM